MNLRIVGMSACIDVKVLKNPFLFLLLVSTLHFSSLYLLIPKIISECRLIKKSIKLSTDLFFANFYDKYLEYIFSINLVIVIKKRKCAIKEISMGLCVWSDLVYE